MKLGFARNEMKQNKSSSTRLRAAAAIFSTFLAFGLEGIARAKAPQEPKLPAACFTNRTPEEVAEIMRLVRKGRVRYTPSPKTFDRDERRIMFVRAKGRLERRKVDFNVCEDKPKPKSDACLAAEEKVEAAKRAGNQDWVSLDFQASQICSPDETSCNPQTGEKRIRDIIQGKVAVLLFTQSGCQPCKIVMPGFFGLYDKFRNRKEFIAVGVVNGAYGEDYTRKDIIDRHARAFGIAFDSLVFREDEDSRPSYVDGYPTIIITNKKGEVIAAFDGGNANLGCDGIAELVERLLAEPAE